MPSLRARLTLAGACAASLAGGLAAARPAGACTTFLLESGGERLFGKSYDWGMGQALVLVNKRGVAKQALTLLPGDRPARWVSRHASLTFNQYGRELPNGGMNDAGLVVEVMWLDGSKFPVADQRPAVSELQWIQYQLDSFASVAEMVAAADGLRVSLAYGKVHYFACDRGGACAAFEHVGGKLVVTSGDAVKVKALTNHTYAESLAYLRRQKGAPRGGGSLERFARASRRVAGSAGGGGRDGGGAGGDQVAAAFGVLDSVRGPASQWNIVYDPVHLRVHFRTLANPRIKSVDLARFDGACGTEVRSLDIDADAGGDVTDRFTGYSDQENRRLIQRSLRDIVRFLPAGVVDLMARYPAAQTCQAAN